MTAKKLRKVIARKNVSREEALRMAPKAVRACTSRIGTKRAKPRCQGK